MVNFLNWILLFSTYLPDRKTFGKQKICINFTNMGIEIITQTGNLKKMIYIHAKVKIGK